MSGLTIDQFRGIQQEVYREDKTKWESPESRKVKFFVDPYFVRTCREYEWTTNLRYRYLLQTGLLPGVKYQIGHPSEFFFLARIRLIFQSIIVNLSLTLMIHFGSESRRSEYQDMREMYRTIEKGSLCHFQYICDAIARGGPKKLSRFFLQYKGGVPNPRKTIYDVSKLAYKLSNKPLHESLSEASRDREDRCNGYELYMILGYLRAQSINSHCWTRGGPAWKIHLEHDKSFQFFDEMEPYVVDLAEKIQNLYDACAAHCSTWKTMQVGAKNDQNLQRSIQAFQETYETTWNKFESLVNALNA